MCVDWVIWIMQFKVCVRFYWEFNMRLIIFLSKYIWYTILWTYMIWKQSQILRVRIHYRTDIHWFFVISFFILNFLFSNKIFYQNLKKKKIFFPGTILVDTLNTSPEAGKTTPYDREILSRLMQAVPDLDRDKLFNQIQEAKHDVSGKSIFISYFKCMVFRSGVYACIRFQITCICFAWVV